MLKITSVLFAALLLYPVARTFYEMCVFERSSDAEERPEDWPPPTTDDGASASFGVIVSQTSYAISPFERLYGILGYGPRRWVGVLGLCATTLIFLLLAYSAFFHLKGDSHSYEWKDEIENRGDLDPPAGSVIIEGFHGESPVTREQNPDEHDGGLNGIQP